MASPQIENGFVRIASELFDALIRIRIPGNERQVFDFILRKTYGFNKKRDRISYGQFVKATGLTKRNVIRSIQILEEKQMIRVDRTEYVNIYQINKNYRQWDIKTGVKSDTRDQVATGVKDDTRKVSKVIPLAGVKSDTHNKQLKDNIKTNGQARHFESKVTGFFASIKSNCDKIKKYKTKNNKSMNPFQWVQEKCNNGSHPGAIDQVIASLAKRKQFWNIEIEPYGYANSILKTVNQNWNERESIQFHEQMKSGQVPDELKDILGQIGVHI